jgi:hypothetical protein
MNSVEFSGTPTNCRGAVGCSYLYIFEVMEYAKKKRVVDDLAECT